jgi:mono/diheme cytochrome c family protein
MITLSHLARAMAPAALLCLGSAAAQNTAPTTNPSTNGPASHADASPGDRAADHTAAQAALADLRAATAVIVAVEDSYATDPAEYRAAAQKAINVLVGTRDPLYAERAGRPDDAAGAIGRIDGLLDRQASPPWVAALRGAEVNARAAVGRLTAARTARELTDFQIAASQALVSLQVAEGTPTEAGVFGGVEGALATTELGVPGDARVVDACATAAEPGWGVHDGYLGFVALAPGTATSDFAEPLGVGAVAMQGSVVVLRTAAWPLVARGCAAPAAADATAQPGAPAGVSEPRPTPHAAPAPTSPANQGAPANGRPAQASAAPSTPAAARAGDAPAQQGAFPALYTVAQARAGQQVYAQNCVTCHGEDLHGRAAPGVAGTEFLATARDNEWSLEVIRYLVFTMMPLNAGGSLTPEQYAEVMAFLLASNCLPAGTTPFPQDDQPSFSAIQLAPAATPSPGQNEFGVCPVG